MALMVDQGPSKSFHLSSFCYKVHPKCTVLDTVEVGYKHGASKSRREKEESAWLQYNGPISSTFGCMLNLSGQKPTTSAGKWQGKYDEGKRRVGEERRIEIENSVIYR